ncbi:MAG: glutamate--cysteine ligase [Herminiimonas sp.]|nr:glutamate--cysteine ligase [Herminiimonas sp.]
MTGNSSSLAAFAGFGIELEYMIVEREHLSPLPLADQLLRAATDDKVSEVDRGMLGWSNEMVLHVIEIKNQRPTAAFADLPTAFHTEVRYINRILELFGARLMPTAMHPWMDPRRETHFWPHGNAEIYQSYSRIFDCDTHGWANLQSMHINLPFADDEQFARLHAAIRLMLPILPALAASSPIAEGGRTGFADFRMEAYRTNAQAIASIAGQVIPETVSSRAEYEQTILAPMYLDIAQHDPQRILRHEWLNSRGAIARFDRNAIEIRVIDTQECPQADLAIAAAAVAVVKMLYDAGTAPLAAQQAIDTDALAAIFLDCIRDAEQAAIGDAGYLALLGFPGNRCTAQQLWRHLIEQLQYSGRRLADLWLQPLQVMLQRGPLARRILQAAGGDDSKEHIEAIYRQLCDCLNGGRMFIPS